MGLFDKLFKKEGASAVEKIEFSTEPRTLYQPMEGEVIPLPEIADGVFSEGVLGQGVGLKPAGEIVYAPLNGTISTVAETKHAVGIDSTEGAEILIHVGLDTVDMNGKGFEPLVKAGDRVTAGQPLLKFSKKAIADAGHPDTSAVLITNSDDFTGFTVVRTGPGKVGDKLISF